MKKLTSILMSVCMLTAVCSFTGCGGEKSETSDSSSQVSEIKVELPSQIAEMVGTYSVEDVSVTNRGKDLGIKKSDLSVCKTVEITDDGKIICKGLFDDTEFGISFNKSEDYIYTLNTDESADAGFVYKEDNKSQDYNVDKDYEGPTEIAYIYNNNNRFFNKGEMHVYIKFNCGTDAWYGILECSKTSGESEEIKETESESSTEQVTTEEITDHSTHRGKCTSCGEYILDEAFIPEFKDFTACVGLSEVPSEFTLSSTDPTDTGFDAYFSIPDNKRIESCENLGWDISISYTGTDDFNIINGYIMNYVPTNQNELDELYEAIYNEYEKKLGSPTKNKWKDSTGNTELMLVKAHNGVSVMMRFAD
ncbi:MAG: hypothetical protein NC177_01155 [Ruminococcus flavefaciens]|nr:hypothetical protein [Ruminococcus flavefaciens]